jgi:PAS domain S-box-containing protein
MALPATLLLVDDDEANRDVLGRRLVRGGYRVDAAASGAEALEMLKDRPYDLVLLDHMMPGMTGHEVLRRIRETWSASDLPVIMVTALDDTEHVVEALREGANDYLTKPLNFHVAMARIDSQLRLSFAGRELRRANELYQLASRAAEEGLWEWDLASGKVYYSPGWKAMLGSGGEEIPNSPEGWLGRVHPEDLPDVRERIRSSLEGGSASLECEYRALHRDGRYRWLSARAGISRDASGRALRVTGYQFDITARKTLDVLTGLPNGLWLAEELRWLAAEGGPAALILLDLDGFELVQHALSRGGPGHLLAAAAARVREAMAASPVTGAPVARSGDHQFALLLRGTHDPARLCQTAAQLQSALREPFAVNGEATFATASAGISLLDPAQPGDDPLRDANIALLRAREQGPGRTEVFQPAMRQQEVERMRLDSDLRQALERAEFEVHYQPKVNLETGAVAGLEALVRWNRPGYGLVPPDRFIPTAERTGLIVTLGRYVLERACRDVVELRRTHPDLWVSVNVSGRQLAENDLVEQVCACLDRAGLEPSGLRLEVTETFLVEDPAKALDTLTRLRRMGIGLKLDDFGSGYSSFEYLQRFPFDTIKIDRSFVARLNSSQESLEIVRAIAGLSRSLNMSVVAEGIEDRQQLDSLKELGCTYGQGYLFSRALNLEGVGEFLAKWAARQDSDRQAPAPVGAKDG